MNGIIKLYRAVSIQEMADLKQSGQLRSVPNSMEGKWFAENLEDAREWGRQLFQQRGEGFQLVEIEIPTQLADQLFRLPNLDQIGPARFANKDQLIKIMQTKPSIREVF